MPNNGTSGATVYVKLWTGSPNINSATFLGSTAPVYMPDGFVNNNLGVAGVTNFCFSTPVALAPGQTYYLQPVVVSGDNPWDIVILGDTYPNGQLYGNGSYFQPGTDLWFREGVVVPEPSTLALAPLGLSCLLILGRKRCRKFLLIVLPALAVVLQSARAQAPFSAAQIPSLQRVDPATLGRRSVFWLVKGPYGGGRYPPTPCWPEMLQGLENSLPLYSLGEGFNYLIDDRSVDYEPLLQSQQLNQALSALEAQVPQRRGPAPMGYTSGLWLENIGQTATNLWWRLHGTVGGDNYQLLSVTNLMNTNWNLGEILFSAPDGLADFSPVPKTSAKTFFRAHHANPVVRILNAQDSREPDSSNNDPGQIGIIYVYNDGATADAVTVYYSIGGTAQNGVDYSTLTGVVTIPANQSSAEIDINPIEDGLKPDQTVILTLLQNTNHLIEPAYYSAVNTLYANPEVVPTAYGDTERPCPNTPLSVTLSAFDPNNLPLTYAILSYPVHGILTGTPPYVTYTPTNCYEGQDSFTFKASNGQFDSAPAAVTLLISDPVYASPPSPQTCRGTPVAVTLSGGDACNETLGYAVLSSPLHGFLSGTPPNLTYTPSGTNFTGLDSFNYLVLSECGGDSATGAVTVTVGDANLSPIAQSVMTGTNRPVSITLGASDVCADTNNYTYTIASFPAHGTLSGTGPNRSYTPNPGYEGLDAFQFTVSDGVWVSAPGSVTLFVVAGPVLAVQTTNGCNPFGSWVQLDWSLDTTVERMRQQNGLNLRDFVVYRSATPGGPVHARLYQLRPQPDELCG